MVILTALEAADKHLLVRLSNISCNTKFSAGIGSFTTGFLGSGTGAGAGWNQENCV